MKRYSGARLWIGVVCAVVVSVAVWQFWRNQRVEYDPLTLSFDGPSDKLQHTIVVPTLDTPMPKGQSVIWCGSFQFAWNELKDDLLKGPVRLSNAQPVADRLNTSTQTKGDVEPADVYAKAGLVKDGITRLIQQEMSQRFPDGPRPGFNDADVAAVAYGYLQVSSKFEFPYFENREPLTFTDSSGTKTAIHSFGIRQEDEYAYRQLRNQVDILYPPRDVLWNADVPEFILDLCKTSHPYQIVLARIDRKRTLAATIADAERRIEAHPQSGNFPDVRDTMLIPNMAWQITHHFKELEGSDKPFLNPALRGLHIGTAMQTIRFRLNRSGAELASEAKIRVKPSATRFHVDRPFLLFVKRRGGEQPFFVMWVDNAELLHKW